MSLIAKRDVSTITVLLSLSCLNDIYNSSTIWWVRCISKIAVLFLMLWLVTGGDNQVGIGSAIFHKIDNIINAIQAI